MLKKIYLPEDEYQNISEKSTTRSIEKNKNRQILKNDQKES